MNHTQSIRYQELAKIIKALAHPTRIFISERLAEREICVNDLTAMLGVDVSTVSKHLSILHEAGIIKKRKEGLQVFYSLKISCVNSFLTCVENILMGNIDEKKTAFNCKNDSCKNSRCNQTKDA